MQVRSFFLAKEACLDLLWREKSSAKKLAGHPSSANVGFLQEASPKHMINAPLMETSEPLQGYSRFSTLPDLAQADLIIPLDHESDDFTKVHRTAIRGEVRPFGMFLPAGSSPYLDDPYDRSEDFDAVDVYNELIHSIRLGCSKILRVIPALIS